MSGVMIGFFCICFCELIDINGRSAGLARYLCSEVQYNWIKVILFFQINAMSLNKLHFLSVEVQHTFLFFTFLYFAFIFCFVFLFYFVLFVCFVCFLFSVFCFVSFCFEFCYILTAFPFILSLLFFFCLQRKFLVFSCLDFAVLFSIMHVVSVCFVFFFSFLFSLIHLSFYSLSLIFLLAKQIPIVLYSFLYSVNSFNFPFLSFMQSTHIIL